MQAVLATATMALAASAGAALAQEIRQLDAHVHGETRLDLAVDGDRIVMELHAPGMDIVGFEYAAATAGDRAVIEAAISRLGRPLQLFDPGEDPACRVETAFVALLEEAHEHDHDHDHDHAHAEADAGAVEAAAAPAATEPVEAHHAEFEAAYEVVCGDIGRLRALSAGLFFEAFPNARVLKIQLVSGRGAFVVELGPGRSLLDLAGKL
ncbi:MAG: DUF2796 domain-containing protein [Bauldia sp.]|nr:DUF2796 domain-containing protein [Bauldia sp.]